MQLIINSTQPIYLMTSEEIVAKKKELRLQFPQEFKDHDIQFSKREFDYVFPGYEDKKTVIGETIIRRDSENPRKFNTIAIMVNTDHFDKESDFNKNNDIIREKHHKIDKNISAVLKCEKSYIPEEVDTFTKVKKIIKAKES